MAGVALALTTAMSVGIDNALRSLNAMQLRQLADDVGDVSKKPSPLLTTVAQKAGLSPQQALRSPQFRAGVEAACLKVGVPRYGDQVTLTGDPSRGGLAAGAVLGHQFRLNPPATRREPGVQSPPKTVDIKAVLRDANVPLDDRLALGLMEMDRLISSSSAALRKELALVKAAAGDVDLSALQSRGEVSGRRLDLLEDTGKNLLKGDVKVLREEFADVLGGMSKAELRILGAKCVKAAQDARTQLFDLGPMDPAFR